MTIAKFTKITCSHGPLTKCLSLNDDGSIRKTAAAQLGRGTFQVCEVHNVGDFAQHLDSAPPNVAFAYGIPAVTSGTLVRAEDVPSTPGAISRTRQNFGWGAGPGIMMLDNDCGLPDDRSYPELLRDEISILDTIDILTRPSSSSRIFNKDTDECLRGEVNQRAYILVSDARKIPVIGKLVEQHLWLAGHGYYAISKAGVALKRTLVDTAVWQPEHLDFVAGAVCSPPLYQPPLPVTYSEGGEAMLGVTYLPKLSEKTLARIRGLERAARETVEPERQRIHESYIEKRVQEFVARGSDEDTARRSVARALGTQALEGSFVITLQDGCNITVGELLSSPEKYHGLHCRDPIEPDYNDDPRIGFISSRNGAKPYIYSHAHGGCRYLLLTPPKTIQIFAGQAAKAADDICDHFSRSERIFDRGHALVEIKENAQARQLTNPAIQYLAGTECDLQQFDQRSNKLKHCDLSDKIANLILSRAGHGVFPKLSAVITAPTMTPAGDIVATPGYDARTGLLLVMSGQEVFPQVPKAPTVAQIRQAFDDLWLAFKDFPFDGSASRSAMLAALLTAVVRPCLPTAPAFGFDAPTPASGKTKLAQCIGALATGRQPGLLPPPNDDEETRKKIATELLAAKQVVIFDNVERQLASPILAAFLTSTDWSDRILGGNTNVEAQNRILIMITGNNLAPVGDLVRRILTIRIDPKMEAQAVWRREFPLDPLDYVIRNRQSLVAAALTLLQGYIAAGKPKIGSGSLASFEQWDGLVRQTVAWLSSLDIPGLDDPIAQLIATADHDPDFLKLRGLTQAWHDKFGDTPKAAKDIVDCVSLNEVVREVGANRAGFTNTKLFTGYLRRRTGQIVEGLKLVRVDGRSHTSLWRVIKADDDEFS